MRPIKSIALLSLAKRDQASKSSLDIVENDEQQERAARPLVRQRAFGVLCGACNSVKENQSRVLIATQAGGEEGGCAPLDRQLTPVPLPQRRESVGDLGPQPMTPCRGRPRHDARRLGADRPVRAQMFQVSIVDRNVYVN